MHPTTFSLDNCLLRQGILVPLSFSASNQQWHLKSKKGPSIQRAWLLEDDLIFIKKRERDPKNAFSHQTELHHVHCTSIFDQNNQVIGWESLFSQAKKALVLFSDYASCSRNHIEFVFLEWWASDDDLMQARRRLINLSRRRRKWCMVASHQLPCQRNLLNLAGTLFKMSQSWTFEGNLVISFWDVLV